MSHVGIQRARRATLKSETKITFRTILETKMEKNERKIKDIAGGFKLLETEAHHKNGLISNVPVPGCAQGHTHTSHTPVTNIYRNNIYDAQKAKIYIA